MSLSKQIYDDFQQDFIQSCEEVENGNISILDVADKFKNEQDFLNELSDNRKTWLSEFCDQITDEAEKYGKDGYKGKIFKKQTRTTLSFKNIPQWQKLEADKKEFEEKSKTALKMVEKGGLNVDENGEEIPLPEVSVTSFLKVEKVK